jgi:HEPN domain
MSGALDPWAAKLLAKAGEDEAVLLIAEVPDGPFGFHAQQAAEKLLKALPSQLGIAFDYTHDVTRLANQLKLAGEVLPATPIALGDLNRFAVVYRYDSIPSLEAPDRPGTIETVRLVREHVLARIASLSATP